MTRRVLGALGALGAVLALAGCGGGEKTTGQTTTGSTTEMETTTIPQATTTQPAEQTTMRIVVAGGVPKGGIVRETVSRGDRVVLVVSSDVADEIHLHGYDLSRDVAAGGTAQLAFVAKIPGRFEIELENRGVQIGDLTVEP